MGSLFKSSGESIADPGATAAWNLAKPYQSQALSGLGGLASQVAANPAYTGQRVADLNPFQTGSANTLGNFANNTAGYANNFYGAGLGNLASSSGVGANYQDIFNRSSADPTQQILASAGQYANSPYADSMIDAANRDTARSLAEQGLTGVALGASGTGNTNSTRTGVESAILKRGAADRMNDTAAGIRSSLFSNGLSMAQNQYNQNLSNMLSANSGLLNAGTYGSGLLNAGQSYATNAFGQGQAAGGVDNVYRQALLDANKAYFDESWQNPLSVYNTLSGAASNATQVKTSAGVTQNPSVFSQVGSFIGAITPKK